MYFRRMSHYKSFEIQSWKSFNRTNESRGRLVTQHSSPDRMPPDPPLEGRSVEPEISEKGVKAYSVCQFSTYC